MDNTADKRNVVGEGQGMHVVAKPVGPVCNLNCAYCFYLKKKVLFNKTRRAGSTASLVGKDQKEQAL